VERRLAAIMYTDMVGFTALGQKNESLALALVEEQRKLLRPIFDRHGGKEVKTIGDAFLVEFPSALEAVRCAYDIQRATREFNITLPDEKKVHLRVGVHLGDVVVSQGDISGDAVNVASRIEHLAEDGGVCVTRQVYDHVQNKFELPLASLGPKSLKNVSAPLEVFKMVMPWDAASPSSVESDRKRVAILPFVSMSPDPNDEYFADGMTDETISTTSSIPGLTLIARTSVMCYKGVAKSIVEIAKELGVGTVLEGSIRKAGNRLRVTVQLIDVRSQGHLWSQSYDRELDDVFAVQADIAKQVADSLKVRILPEDSRQLEKEPTKSSEAHTLYLKGRYYWNERRKESVLKAIEYFRRAVEVDQSYALAYSGLANCYHILSDHGYLPASEGNPRAEEAALKALGLDDTLPEAHAAYGATLAFYYWRWKEAEVQDLRSIELNPNFSTGHQWRSVKLRAMGRLDEAQEEGRKALRLDPMSPVINVNQAEIQQAMRRYEQGIDYCRSALAIDQNFVPALVVLIQLYALKSMSDEALDELQKLELLRTSQVRNDVLRAFVYAKSARKEEADNILKVSSQKLGEYVPPSEFAMAYAALGQNESAFEWLDKAYELRDAHLPFIKTDPVFDGLQSDPRFVTLLKKIGLS
jgi:adenylate cyclase